MDWVPVTIVIALAMGLTYANGYHDAANAVVTSVSTRALTPRIALSMAAVANLVGAFFGTKVAVPIGSGIIDAPQGAPRVSGSSGRRSSGHRLEPRDVVARPPVLVVARAHRRSRRRGTGRRGSREVAGDRREGHHPDDPDADCRPPRRLPRHDGHPLERQELQPPQGFPGLPLRTDRVGCGDGLRPWLQDPDLPRGRLRRRADPPSASESAVVGAALRSDATTGRSPAAPCLVGSAPPCAAGDWLSWLSRICRGAGRWG